MPTQLTPYQRKLVEENAALAQFLARRRWEMAPDKLEYEELVALAYQGLVSAALRFDPSREEIVPGDLENGKAFSGFARQRILGAILDWQKRDADHVPRSYRTDYKLLQRSGYPETVKDYTALSHSTGLPTERIRLVVAAVERMPVSFDQLSEGANSSGEEVLSTASDVEESVISRSIKDSLVESVSKMSELQQTVLAMRYYLGIDLQAIADNLETPVVAVREAHNSAIVIAQEAMMSAVHERTSGG